jgi:hypothetical protein
MPASVSAPGPMDSFQKPQAGPRRPVAPLSRLTGNHDFLIVVECTGNAVILRGTRFPLASLPNHADPNHPLVKAVQTLVTRRQATVRPGEPAYRPILRFQVRPDGLRTYFLAYDLLKRLGIPMTREDVE